MLIGLSLNYLSILVWKSKQCEDILCPCITYFTLWPVLSQMSMTTEFRAGRPTQTIPVSARAGSNRPRLLATHPQHKPTQTAVIAGRHKLSRPIRARARPRRLEIQTPENRSMRKPRTLERVRGRVLISPLSLYRSILMRTSCPSLGDARQYRRAWREN